MNAQDAYKLGWTTYANGAQHKAGHKLTRINGKWQLIKMATKGDDLVAQKPVPLSAASLGDAIQAATRKL